MTQMVIQDFQVKISSDLLKNLKPEVLDKILTDLYNLNSRFKILTKYKNEDLFLDSLGDYKSFYLAEIDKLTDIIYQAWDRNRLFLLEHGSSEEDLPYLGS